MSTALRYLGQYYFKNKLYEEASLCAQRCCDYNDVSLSTWSTLVLFFLYIIVLNNVPFSVFTGPWGGKSLVEADLTGPGSDRDAVDGSVRSALQQHSSQESISSEPHLLHTMTHTAAITGRSLENWACDGAICSGTFKRLGQPVFEGLTPGSTHTHTPAAVVVVVNIQVKGFGRLWIRQTLDFWNAFCKSKETDFQVFNVCGQNVQNNKKREEEEQTCSAEERHTELFTDKTVASLWWGGGDTHTHTRVKTSHTLVTSPSKNNTFEWTTLHKEMCRKGSKYIVC